jgi:hypothetical protein
MVARDPDHGREPLAEHPQRPLDVSEPLGDIARYQQPVVRVLRPQVLDVRAVLWKCHVQVAEGQQPGGLGTARSHVAEATPPPSASGHSVVAIFPAVNEIFG